MKRKMQTAKKTFLLITQEIKINASMLTTLRPKMKKSGNKMRLSEVVKAKVDA